MENIILNKQTKLLNEVPLTRDTIKMDVTPNGIKPSGIIFNADETLSSYYSLHLESPSDHRLVLIKHINGEDIVLGNMYMSAGHCPTLPTELKIILDGNQIECFYKNKLYIYRFKDESLKGHLIGVFTENENSKFENIIINDDTSFKTVTTLITGHSYMELWENYKTDLSYYKNIYNIGIGGTVAPDWCDHIDEVVRYQPKEIIYVIDINDVGRGLTPNQFIDYVKDYVNALLTRLPNSKICLVSVNICPMYKNDGKIIDEMNRLLKEFADSDTRLYYADIDRAFLTKDGKPDDSCFVDGLHPTKEAYLVIRDAIYKVFK